MLIFGELFSANSLYFYRNQQEKKASLIFQLRSVGLNQISTTREEGMRNDGEDSTQNSKLVSSPVVFLSLFGRVLAHTFLLSSSTNLPGSARTFLQVERERKVVDWIEEKIKFNVACGSDYSSKVSCCCHSPSCVR